MAIILRLFRHAGLKRKGMEIRSHFSLQRLINKLVLFYPVKPLKLGRGHKGRVMIAISAQILDLNRCIRNALLNQAFNFGNDFEQKS